MTNTTMIKTTRAVFVRTLEEKKTVHFGGVIKNEILEQTLQFINEEKALLCEYSKVKIFSNKIGRELPNGKLSYLDFSKGDEVFKIELNKIIVFIYRTFTNIIYVVKK